MALVCLQFKFHKILFIGYLVKINLWNLNQFKDNKSYTTDASMTKLNGHCCVLIIQNVVSFKKLHWLVS